MGDTKSSEAEASGGLRVRLKSHRDSISEITRLLHRAYAAQVAMGLRPLAGRQDDDTTRRRCAAGECYLAVTKEGAARGAEKILGIILFHEVEDDQGPPWFQNKFVDAFSQFAVDPDAQGRGVGGMLLDRVERRAAECGASEIACSMADPDEGLKRFYLKRGYRFVEYWQWPYTNYKSAILSKVVEPVRT
ncbi:MAG: GNAT family N-acetyltransferase [Phycisphaerales bacterium]